MPTELYLGNNKLTLGEANGGALLSAEAKNLSEVVHVGREVLAKDQNFIHVDKTELKIPQGPEPGLLYVGMCFQ